MPVNDVRLVRAIDGRVLHAMLHVQDCYEHWLTNHIEQFRYELWLDYVPSNKNDSNFPVRIDYLTIDMAWELALFEMTGCWQALCDFFSSIERLTYEEYFGSAASVADEKLAAAA